MPKEWGLVWSGLSTSLRVEWPHEFCWKFVGVGDLSFILHVPSCYSMLSVFNWNMCFTLWAVILCAHFGSTYTKIALYSNNTFFYCPNCCNFGHLELPSVYLVSLWHTSIIVGSVCLFCTLPYFWELQTAPGSSCMCPTLILDVTIPLRALASFIGNWY